MKADVSSQLSGQATFGGTQGLINTCYFYKSLPHPGARVSLRKKPRRQNVFNAFFGWSLCIGELDLVAFQRHM